MDDPSHNLKVIGSNPIPATRQQTLENVRFSKVFCCPNFGRRFHSWKRREESRSVKSAGWPRGDDSIVIRGPLRTLPSTLRRCPVDCETGGQEFGSLRVRQTATILNKTTNPVLDVRIPWCNHRAWSKVHKLDRRRSRNPRHPVRSSGRSSALAHLLPMASASATRKDFVRRKFVRDQFRPVGSDHEHVLDVPVIDMRLHAR